MERSSVSKRSYAPSRAGEGAVKVEPLLVDGVRLYSSRSFAAEDSLLIPRCSQLAAQPDRRSRRFSSSSSPHPTQSTETPARSALQDLQRLRGGCRSLTRRQRARTSWTVKRDGMAGPTGASFTSPFLSLPAHLVLCPLVNSANGFPSFPKHIFSSPNANDVFPRSTTPLPPASATVSGGSSIDWTQEYARERLRKSLILATPGLRGVIVRLWDASKPWVVVVLTGMATGVIASCLDILSAWLSDLRLGACRDMWWMSRGLCCAGLDRALALSWSQRSLRTDKRAVVQRKRRAVHGGHGVRSSATRSTSFCAP